MKAELSEFQGLKGNKLLSSNQIIVEGPKGIRKLLQKNFKIKKVLIEDALTEEFSGLCDRAEEVFKLNSKEIKELTGFNYHKGLLALAEGDLYSPLKELKPPYLILNGLTSPENVGSIIRTARAFEVESIIIDSKTVSPYLRRCIRVSMGNIFDIKVHKTKNLLELMGELKKEGISFVGTAHLESSIDIKSWKSTESEAIIIGSEGHGMDQEIIEACDKVIKIPISDYVAHLNASVAASIVLYHRSL